MSELKVGDVVVDQALLTPGTWVREYLGPTSIPGGSEIWDAEFIGAADGAPYKFRSKLGATLGIPREKFAAGAVTILSLAPAPQPAAEEAKVVVGQRWKNRDGSDRTIASVKSSCDGCHGNGCAEVTNNGRPIGCFGLDYIRGAWRLDETSPAPVPTPAPGLPTIGAWYRNKERPDILAEYLGIDTGGAEWTCHESRTQEGERCRTFVYPGKSFFDFWEGPVPAPSAGNGERVPQRLRCKCGSSKCKDYATYCHACWFDQGAMWCGPCGLKGEEYKNRGQEPKEARIVADVLVTGHLFKSSGGNWKCSCGLITRENDSQAVVSGGPELYACPNAAKHAAPSPPKKLASPCVPIHDFSNPYLRYKSERACAKCGRVESLRQDECAPLMEPGQSVQEYIDSWAAASTEEYDDLVSERKRNTVPAPRDPYRPSPGGLGALACPLNRVHPTDVRRGR